MLDALARYGIYYLVYFLEVVLLAFLVWRGHWRRWKGIFLYVASLLAIDGIGRSYVLARYGFSSHQYAYFFWLTDVVLVLAAFLLICALSRQACHHEANLWRHVRLLLSFVFVLVLGMSLLSLHRNYQSLFSRFIIEFQQNLYFTCLILLTLLYVLMQKIEGADEELALLVCGLGIQFAGPAANFALVHLTPGQHYASLLYTYVGPLCTLGMLLIWFYAITHAPRAVGVPGFEKKGGELAEAVAREA
jgi:hypothetical protein